ncbi:3-oxoacyl-ACP reductase FabG [Alkalibacillus haloalkaliphilus]|uniref:3-oxoacyl-[acyl-carrier-protein] reductase FabG n=1 Tax=Alkalibacillus haloalkaliphilus TaxID=94136 RepID=A0A511W129_9BACI|nr:3-oxoacyl-ACP reductase FabG [Alkalibacillus haloalkaliphilus]GEN44800.1 3-oxoacyl-[acyl-carrier-protein] reductase FabG [Alkalibacillus haloalkaliphilus]
MARLDGRVAIITGGANGIGYAAANLFGKEGAKVVLADFDVETGKEKAQQLQNEDFDVMFVQVNVADRISVDHMIEQVIKQYGKIDILVNNAGITRDGMLSKMSVEDFQQVIDVNLTGVFHCTQAALPYLLEQGKGKVINTSSVSGTYGNVGQTNYAAAKAGLIGMTKTWAKELGRKQINVNAVAPGFTETSMVESVPEHIIEGLKKQVPMGRLGQPEDIAKAYLYLASDDSDYVNGQVINVDGAIMM